MGELFAPTVVTHLAREAKWASGWAYGERLAYELYQHAHQIRALTSPPPAPLLGECPVTIGVDGERVTCGTRVRANPGKDGEIRCRGCGTKDTIDGWLLRIVGTNRPVTIPQLVQVVPAECFTPPPKVDSSFMVLERLETPYVDGGDEAVFARLVRSAFAMRRKTLLNNLISGFALNREQATSCLEAVGLSVQVRAEELSLEDFAKLSRQLQSL